MFEANLVPMAAAAADLKKMTREINTCLAVLSGVYGSLHKFSYMDQPLHRIKAAEGKLDEKSAQTVQLRLALENICQQYQHSEKNILDSGEAAAAAARRREQFFYSKVG